MRLIQLFSAPSRPTLASEVPSESSYPGEGRDYELSFGASLQDKSKTRLDAHQDTGSSLAQGTHTNNAVTVQSKPSSSFCQWLTVEFNIISTFPWVYSDPNLEWFRITVAGSVSQHYELWKETGTGTMKTWTPNIWLSKCSYGYEMLLLWDL